MASRSSARLLITFVLVGILMPSLALATLPAPFVWIFLLWAMASFFAAFRRRGSRAARLFLALAAVFFALFLGETGLTLTHKETGPRAQGGVRYRAPLDGIGFGPRAGTQTEIEGIEHGEKLYRATYTIGADGWRVTPAAEAPIDGAILCLGGSFTYGEGLNDEQTYPWLLANDLDRRYEVHNLAFQGWGAHQMLALIESGRADAVLEAPLRHAIYLAIPHHVRRAVGLTRWALDTPRYVRAEDGTIVRKGMLADAAAEEGWTERLRGRLRHEFEKSRLLRRLRPRARATPEDVDLCLDIVLEARRLLLTRHPASAFHVLVWDDALQDAEAFAAALEERGHDVVRASSFLEGLDRPPSHWHLGRWDGHPSAAAAREIARWAARLVLDAQPGTEAPLPGR